MAARSRFFARVRAFSSPPRWAGPSARSPGQDPWCDGHRTGGRSIGDHTGSAPEGIFTIDLDTGHRRQVTQAPNGIGDLSFDISPDGRTLAFIRYGRPGIGDLYVVPIEGGEARRLTNWDAEIGGVTWMPNGRQILYSVHEATGLDQYLFRIAADGNGLERGARALHTTVTGPSISRPTSGRPSRVAFTTGRIDVGLQLLDLAHRRSGAVIENRKPLSDSTRIEHPGRFSRTGERVSFVSSRTGWAEAWVVNRDGSSLEQVTTLRATEMLIGGWSPDHRRFVIDAAISGNSDSVSCQCGRRTARPSNHGSGLRWSRRLVCRWTMDLLLVGPLRQSRSLEIPAEGGRAQQVTRHGGMQPREAPDGLTLYYIDRSPSGIGGVNGTSRLLQVSVNGGDERAVVEPVRFGLWSVIDEGIAFVTIEPGGDALDLYSFATREIRRIGVLPQRVSRFAGLGGLAVASDGRSAIISVTDHWESDVMVADGLR